MTTADIVFTVLLSAYAIAGVYCAVMLTREILSDHGYDPWGTPMRHRWDIPLLGLFFGPPWWVITGAFDAITWCWKKLVD